MPREGLGPGAKHTNQVCHYLPNHTNDVPMADPTVKQFDARLPINLTSDFKADLIETGNAGQYLRQAAKDRLERYEAARRHLHARGWGRLAMKACAAVLQRSGPIDFGRPLDVQIAEAMREYPEDAYTRDVTLSRWGDLIEQVETDDTVARAVRAVAQEFLGPSDHIQ